MEFLFIYLPSLAATIAMVMAGASKFRLQLDIVKVTISIVAAFAAIGFIQIGALPFLQASFSKLPQGVSLAITLLVLCGIPLAVLSICLKSVVNVTTKEAQALGCFGWGGAMVAIGVCTALVTKKPTTVNAVTAATMDAVYMGCWLLIGLGSVVCGIGFWLGSKLPTSTAYGGENTMGTISPVTNHNATRTVAGAATSSGEAPTVLPNKPTKIIAWIVVTNGDLKGTRYDLREGDMKLGRSSTVDILVSGDPEVGREHALVRVRGTVCELHDMASKGGTFLNGNRVTTARTLQDGDEIKVGQSKLQFKRVEVSR